LSFLGDALPGLREVRVQLLAGYLWILFAWLAFISDIDISRSRSDAVAAVVDMADAVGPLGVTIAVSVAAFLVGAVSQEVSWHLERTSRGSAKLRRHTAEIAAGKAYGEIAEQFKRRNVRLDDEMAGILERSGFERWKNGVVDAAVLELSDTRTLPSHGPDVGVVDRLYAEGDLRLAVVPPLFALTVFLTVDLTPLWAFGLLPTVILEIQGVRKKDEARRRMVDLVMLGRLELAAIRRFKLEAELSLAERGGETSARA
jgi:hypothetical protein